MRITVNCPSCGATWQSQTTSGRTRCGHCGTRVYVPMSVRRQAGLGHPHTTEMPQPRSVERTAVPRSSPRPTPAARVAVHSDNPTRPTVGQRPHGRDIFDLLAPLAVRAATSKRSTPVPAENEIAAAEASLAPVERPATPGLPCAICRTGTTLCAIPGCPSRSRSKVSGPKLPDSDHPALSDQVQSLKASAGAVLDLRRHAILSAQMSRSMAAHLPGEVGHPGPASIGFPYAQPRPRCMPWTVNRPSSGACATRRERIAPTDSRRFGLDTPACRHQPR